MALTTNQGLDIPDGSDNANVPLSFTNYNTGVESRLVERFLSIADRTARNPAPFEGELSYLADLNRYEWYTGTAWTELVPVPASASDATSFFITSLVYTTAGAPVTGATIVVPPSGVVRVGYAALLNHSGGGQTLISPQLNAGSVVGAGATIVAASDANGARITGVGPWTTGSFLYFSGLTAGTSVNSFLMHRVTAITGSAADRHLEIEQA
jgi:hypothetical protein